MPARTDQAILLDWNGTLLDDLGLVYKSIVEIFRTYRVCPPTLKKYRDEISNDFMRFYWNHGIPRNARAEDLNRIRGRVLRRGQTSRHLQKNAKRILHILERDGILCGLVSAEVPVLLRWSLRDFGVADSFALTMGGAYHKRAAISRAIRQLGVSPGRTIYVGDTADDVFSAKGAECIAVGYTRGYNSRSRLEKAKPDFLIDDLLQIQEVSREVFA